MSYIRWREPYNHWLAGSDVGAVYHIVEISELPPALKNSSKGISLAEVRKWPSYSDNEVTLTTSRGERQTISLKRWADADPEKTILVLYEQMLLPPGKDVNYLLSLREKALAAQEAGAPWPPQ